MNHLQQQILDLLEPLVEALIEYPDEMEIDIQETGSTVVVCLDLVPSDRAKVIGKGGKIINGLRSYFTAFGGRHEKAILLEVIE